MSSSKSQSSVSTGPCGAPRNNKQVDRKRRCFIPANCLCCSYFFLFFMSCCQKLSVRGKNKKEKLEDFFKNVVKSADGVLVAGVKVKTQELVSTLIQMLFPCFLFIDSCCFCACRMWMISLSTRRRFCWNITTESRMLQPSLTEWSDHTKVRICFKSVFLLYVMFVSVAWAERSGSGSGLVLVSSNSLNRDLEFYIKENCVTLMSTYLCVFCLDAADDINRIASSLYTLGTQDSTDLCKYEQMLSLNLTWSCLHVMNISFWESGFLLTLVFGPEQSQVVNIPASHLSCYFVPFSSLRFFLKVSELFEKTRVCLIKFGVCLVILLSQ